VSWRGDGSARGDRGQTPPDIEFRAPGLRVEGGGGYYAGPSGPGAVAAPPPVQPSYALPPWFYVKPPRARDFTAFGELTGLTAAAGETVVTGATFQVPAGNIPVVRSVTFDVNLLTPTSNLFFSMKQNGSPVEGWSNIRLFPRTATTISIAYGPDETFPLLPEGCRIDVTAIVLAPDAGPYQLGANFHGWYVDVNVYDALQLAYARAGM